MHVSLPGLLNALIDNLTVLLDYINLLIQVAGLYALPGPPFTRPLIKPFKSLLGLLTS